MPNICGDDSDVKLVVWRAVEDRLFKESSFFLHCSCSFHTCKAVIKCLLVAKMCSRASGLCAWFKMKSLSVRASARLPHTYWDHRCSHPQCGVLLNPGLTHSFRFDVDIGSCWRIISSSCTGGHVGWWRQPQPGASCHLSRLGVSGLNNITHPEARFIQVPFKVMTAGWINGVMSCLLFSCSSISDA